MTNRLDLDYEFEAATRYAIFVGDAASRCIGEYDDQDQALDAAKAALAAEPEGTLITQRVTFADGETWAMRSMRLRGMFITDVDSKGSQGFKVIDIIKRVMAERTDARERDW